MGRALPEAHHRRLVAHLGQASTGLGADALRRGVPRNQLWVRPLERDEAIEQRVILGVRDARRIERVIGVIVRGDDRSQAFELSGGIDVGRGAHRGDRLLRRAATSVDA